MDDLSTYQLSDFILFSQATYYRQFELYNQAIWPLHLIAILFAGVVFYVLWKKPLAAGQIIAAILVTSWLWVAWAFLYQYFYKIHVVANWYALGFVIEAGMLAWYGGVKNVLQPESDHLVRTGFVVLIFALVVYPVIAMLTNRNEWQLEMFSLAPDPTAIATLALLSITRATKVLYVIPALWVLISGVTQMVME